MGAKSKSIWINYNYIPLSWFNVAPSLPNALKTNIILAADSIAKIKKKRKRKPKLYSFASGKHIFRPKLSIAKFYVHKNKKKHNKNVRAQ